MSVTADSQPTADQRADAPISVRLGKGTVIHIHGIPFALDVDTLASTHPANVKLAAEGIVRPDEFSSV